jgi:hypothetical protein
MSLDVERIDRVVDGITYTFVAAASPGNEDKWDGGELGGAIRPPKPPLRPKWHVNHMQDGEFGTFEEAARAAQQWRRELALRYKALWERYAAALDAHDRSA